MKYKSNYIEKINILPQEIQDKILDKVFLEHKKFVKKIDYSFEVYSVIQEKIDKYFQYYIIEDTLPLDISCLTYLSEKDEVLHIFDDNEEPIIYIDRTQIINDIFCLYSQHDMGENLFEIHLNTFSSEEDKKEDEEFYNFMQYSSRILTIEEAILTLLNEYNFEIKFQNEENNIPMEELYCFNHRFLECIDVVYRDNKVILEWFNGS
tara:strand:- start:71 stop:691 length:621 start_codon:yes stop_codon:yes gene_type:complete